MVVAEGDLKVDRPYLRAEVNSQAKLECCHTYSHELLNSTWMVKIASNIKPVKVNETDEMIIRKKKGTNTTCHTLSFKSVHVNHTGLYQCELSASGLAITTPGTYLHVISKCLYAVPVGGALNAG